MLYAPTEEQITILIDVLEDSRLPFILAEGNAPSEVKDMLRGRIGKGSNKGLLVTWAPQSAILSHPVCNAVGCEGTDDLQKSTALFLTHGGSNSAMESILFQVPMGNLPQWWLQPCLTFVVFSTMDCGL